MRCGEVLVIHRRRRMLCGETEALCAERSRLTAKYREVAVTQKTLLQIA